MIENKNLNNAPDDNNVALKGLCPFLDAILNITTNKIKRITLLVIVVVFSHNEDHFGESSEMLNT